MKKFYVYLLLLLSLSCMNTAGYATTYDNNDSAISGTNGVPKNDQVLLQEIKQKVSASKNISDLKVGITVNDAVVSLSGSVATDSEADALIETIQSVDGVRDVITTDLKVMKSTHALSDTVITAKVKGVYLREKLFGDKDVAVWNIKVETKDGIVYLLGTADNQRQITNAIDLARKVSGVKSVKSKVDLNGHQLGQ